MAVNVGSSVAVGGERRTCRICLLGEDFHDNDNVDPMIVPCRCTGDQKYVHTSCLEHWRTYQQPSEFRQCRRCSFYYHLPSREGNNNNGDPCGSTAGEGPEDSATKTSSGTSGSNKRSTTGKKNRAWRRQARLCFAIVFDFVMVTLVVQGLVIGAGYLLWYLDSERAVAQALGESVNCVSRYRRLQADQDDWNSSSVSPATDTNSTLDYDTSSGGENDYYCNHVGSIYYFLGFLLITFIAGAAYLCCGCCLNNSASTHMTSRHGSQTTTDEENPLPTREAHNSPNFYRRRQERRQQRQNNSSIANSVSDGCCLGPCRRKFTNAVHDLKHDVRVGTERASQGGLCGDSSCGNFCNGGLRHQTCCTHSEGLLVVLVALVLVGILMTALSGLMVIMIVLVIVFQRIVQRHVHFMHRKRLVQEFPVVDLSAGGTLAVDNTINEKPRPKLADSDLHSLRKLGMFLGPADEEDNEEAE